MVQSRRLRPLQSQTSSASLRCPHLRLARSEPSLLSDNLCKLPACLLRTCLIWCGITLVIMLSYTGNSIHTTVH